MTPASQTRSFTVLVGLIGVTYAMVFVPIPIVRWAWGVGLLLLFLAGVVWTVVLSARHQRP